jgi:ATP-dependent Clp protease protease subunit
LRTKKIMNEILSHLTGQPLERVERDTDRDNFMTAREALEYGLVDQVLERLPPGQIPVRAPSS